MLGILANIAQILSLPLGLIAVWVTVYPDRARRFAPATAALAARTKRKVSRALVRFGRPVVGWRVGRVTRFLTTPLVGVVLVSVSNLLALSLITGGFHNGLPWPASAAAVAGGVVSYNAVLFLFGENKSLAGYLGYLAGSWAAFALALL